MDAPHLGNFVFVTQQCSEGNKNAIKSEHTKHCLLVWTMTYINISNSTVLTESEVRLPGLWKNCLASLKVQYTVLIEIQLHSLVH